MELRLLREARADDARGLVRADPQARCHLLRRGRLAGDGARSHFAVGLADPVAARLRPVRQHAAVPLDAGHPVAAREPQARRHRFRRRAREHRGRIFIGRRPRVRRNRARDGVPADHIHAHGRRPHHEVRVRTGKDAQGEARHLGDQVQRHLDHDALLGRALPRNGRALSGHSHRSVPYRHPHRAFRAATRTVRRRRRVESVRRHPFRSGAGGVRDHRHRAIREHQSRAEVSVDLRAGARLGARHRRQRASPIRSDRSGQGR